MNSKLYFIGIGGVGMCGLAELLHNLGAEVRGSDLAINANVQHLNDIGITTYKGHKAEQVGDVDVVVYSSAVKSDNPEIQEAKARGIPIIQRAEILSEIMDLRRGIAVAGTHGKTTTTSMLGNLLVEAELDPTIVVGGRLDVIKSTALLGQGEWLVAEADESDGSFLRLNPEISVITNIDLDHMDHYGSEDNLLYAFKEFAMKVPFYGRIIAFGDDARIQKCLSDFPKRIYFYGFDDKNDFQLKGSNSLYEVYFQGDLLGELDVPMPGKHNALNAMAAVIAAMELGLSFNEAVTCLKRFQGVGRRLEFKGERSSLKVYDDYAHHPTEILSSLQAFRESFPKEHITLYFQPHRYTRTKDCWQEFLNCFSNVDQLLIDDIYQASEQEIEGINSERLAVEIEHPNVQYFPKKDVEMNKKLEELVGNSDIIITMGAGDIWQVGESLLQDKNL